MTRPFALLMIVLVLSCCSRRDPGVIASAGTYSSPSGSFQVNITLGSDDTVRYSIVDAATTPVVNNAGGFSTHHRWFFFWDERNRLWTYNSDAGPFAVWFPDDRGEWIMHPVGSSSPLIGDMPEPVIIALPDSMKRTLGVSSR